MAATRKKQERVKYLLSSFLHSDNSDRLTTDGASAAEQNVEKARNIVSSRDRQKFLERVQTYTPFTWFAKPDELSPLQCSRYGWQNVDTDMLQCTGCHVFLCAKLPQTFVPGYYGECCEKLKNSLQTAHSRLCPWQNNPSPVWFSNLPLEDKQAVFKDFTSRLHSLAAILNKLPQICSDNMNLETEDQDLLTSLAVKQLASISESQALPTADLDEASVAAMISLSGWQRDERSSGHPLLCCKFCQRQVGLWNFLSMKGEDSHHCVQAERDPTEAAVVSSDVQLSYENGLDAKDRTDKSESLPSTVNTELSGKLQTLDESVETAENVETNSVLNGHQKTVTVDPVTDVNVSDEIEKDESSFVSIIGNNGIDSKVTLSESLPNSRNCTPDDPLVLESEENTGVDEKMSRDEIIEESPGLTSGETKRESENNESLGIHTPQEQVGNSDNELRNEESNSNATGSQSLSDGAQENEPSTHTPLFSFKPPSKLDDPHVRANDMKSEVCEKECHDEKMEVSPGSLSGETKNESESNRSTEMHTAQESDDTPTDSLSPQNDGEEESKHTSLFSFKPPTSSSVGFGQMVFGQAFSEKCSNDSEKLQETKMCSEEMSMENKGADSTDNESKCVPDGVASADSKNHPLVPEEMATENKDANNTDIASQCVESDDSKKDPVTSEENTVISESNQETSADMECESATTCKKPHVDADEEKDQPPKKMQKRNTFIHHKTKFNPVTEHRTWCPWVAETDLEPGWKRNTSVILSHLKVTSTHRLGNRSVGTSSYVGLQSIRRLFDGWTSPEKKHPQT